MLSKKAKMRREKIRRHTALVHDPEGEGLMDIFSSIGKAAGSVAKTVGTAAKAAAPHVATAAKYVGKHADSWAPPLMNATSQLIAAKMRSKATDINKEAEKLLHDREIERLKAHDQPKDELSQEEIDRLLRELATGRGVAEQPQQHHTTGFISGKGKAKKDKSAQGLYLTGTSGNAPVNASTMQGLSQTVGGNGLHRGIFKLH